ncbi:MBL fold metallo-hydrolase [Cedecea sp.]|jgi:7,8-dihydropterin-6-yl-methyl-4-(beta-D-ribofuranosyl)aminobenzene 5'-phosphate synthase|uniref:MBL fold metallo-hydrolase n=1 Tax=Cedecea sp. TaxID=1970739 RepID=UPI0012AE0993|nr:MBL fold metallo-hydrolase [Enterobacteriaceae bacterium RIT693]
MALKITVLLENRRAAGKNPALLTKPGISLLIEEGNKTVLFDTGPDSSFQHNAKLLNVNLATLDTVVLSHGHYDHCGGVPWLPDQTHIICHPDIVHTRYAALFLPGCTKRIKKLSRDNDYSRHRTVFTRSPIQISDTLLWSGEIMVPEPQAYGVLGGKASGHDYVVDEGVLIYTSPNGLVIITGCGHRGIVNIVKHCQQITGIERVHAVVGGFHLRCVSPLKIWRIKQFLRTQKVDYVMGCHCTGTWGRWWLPGTFSPATGDVLTFD